MAEAEGSQQWKNNRGKKQSPVDIDIDKVKFDRKLKDFHFEELRTVSGVEMKIKNYDHKVKIAVSGTRLTVRGGSLDGNFVVDNCHFHWGSNNSTGSEHTINGQHAAMEMHFVLFSNKYDTMQEALDESDEDSESTTFAVLAVLVEVGEYNNKFEDLIKSLKEIPKDGDTAQIEPFYLTDLFPKDTHYFRYEGSFTTPPYLENVIWSIFRKHIQISQKQIEHFRDLAKNSSEADIVNYRDIQPLNDREITSNKFCDILKFKNKN